MHAMLTIIVQSRVSRFTPDNRHWQQADRYVWREPAGRGVLAQRCSVAVLIRLLTLVARAAERRPFFIGH